MSEAPALAVTVKGLVRRFGEFVAVDGIDLHVKRGEVFGFLGPNGAGKSTTIRMLTGLLMPSAGQGTVAGLDIITASEEIKKRIGYMSQRFSLYDDLSVQENIEFFGGIYSVEGARLRERTDWVLAMSGLSDKKDTLTSTLAGGFKQRLALGCALLHEPPILFLDEPTSGVDPVSRRSFWALIASLSRSGTTVFLTTHYMDEADYCDRLAMIYRGRVVAEGTPRQLRAEHMKRAVLEVTLPAHTAFEALEVLRARGLDASVFGSALHVVATQQGSGTLEINAALERAGIKPLGISAIEPSLEDVFVALIEGA